LWSRNLLAHSIRGRISPNRSGDASEYADAEDAEDILGLNTIWSPLNPLVDLIFVHGLGGGSRKTWTEKGGQYWLKEWLPEDPGFKDVRIHSFGYKADWWEMRDSTLGINDFAISLLGQIRNNPGIKGSSVRDYPKVYFRFANYIN
jgi:hypothetical protein